MLKLKIGIIKEGKTPLDKRVPLTPKKCVELMAAFPGAQVVVQPSEKRCFSDAEYQELDIPLQQNLQDCDILMGVKEVPVEQLIPDKTYFFFSHTIKEQPQNAKLLRSILQKNITLIDYETLTNAHGQRLVAFGRYAGIVGAYNGIRTYGLKWKLFNLKPAYLCREMEDMQEEYFKVKLPPIKIAVTGGGRVAGGAMEVLDKMRIKKVSVFDYLYKQFREPVYAQLHSGDYNNRPDVEVWDSPDFYQHPQLYKSTFRKFTRVTDLLLACAYWDPRAPKLFTEQEIRAADFKINTIADITCDINGSILCTKRSATIDAPAYDYNPTTELLESAYSKETNITVMAVDNLPCELPRNASRDFSRQLLDRVFPHLFTGDKEGVLQRGTIATAGKLTERYLYMEDYVEQTST
ncbi:alanine dehydrogenase [Pontibacter qinzhouensis]|uniref:Saccharopine dehydrogenase [NAD(+), L-lysine-forming] n=1 Tax=Pontibacter qinzhouensis TaxID=2603253 RepID=A0A5C8JK27_9BACT|nr:NAD(P)-dependent oxidoreductase [Pontibacter qinzhouensis]TXK37802.1 alanine dehydrogenase [Pontibacter qinzhouensis]